MPDGLVTIASYDTPFEANLVRSKLDAFGIEAVLADECAIGANWLWSNALGGVKVQVPESQVEDARRILQTEQNDEQGGQEIPPATAGSCPVCGSTNTHLLIDKRGSFLTWLVLGLPVLPARFKMACTDCGHKSKA